ncbi:hypothetical protein JCM19376_29110 [Fusibacter bizertensis]
MPLATFANSENNLNKYIKEIVVDGIKYIAESKNNKFTLEATNSNIYFELKSNGKGGSTPEIDQIRYIGNYYFYHYHTVDRNGAHEWFGFKVAGTVAK